MSIKVEINKNLTLLYCLLNRFDQAGGESDSHPLRVEIKNHFKTYKGNVPDIKDYIHEHKVVVWSLTVGNPPTFVSDVELPKELEWHFNMGATIKPFVTELYKNSDFEDYYNNYISKKLYKLKNEIESILLNAHVEQLLEDAWGIKVRNKMVVIPNPFTWGSFGPQIGDINYQVIGIMGDVNKNNLLHTVVHEGSHPLAKQILKPYLKRIEKKQHLLEKVQKHQKFSNSYSTWNTCFEEHLIRAVHMGFIAPKIMGDYDVKEGFAWEKNRKGMILIDTFYENLVGRSVSEAIPLIIEALK
ncbi:DUF4932 domain-containing protein [Patescibacteria group bacterium]